MSFAAPAHLSLLVAPAAAVVVVLWRHRRRLLQQRGLASPAVWDRLLGGVPATGLARLLAWCAAAALVVLALARPQWGDKPAEESVRTRDLVVAVDVSDSMRCPDLSPSRLTQSLAVVERALPGLEGNRVGVVVFAGDAYPLVPLTTDLQAAASFLEVVEPGMVALPGSNIERAVAAGLELLPSEGEGRVLVLITDGENLQGDPAAAAAALADAKVGVLAVVSGTEQGGPIPLADADGSLHYKRDQNGQPVVTRARAETLEAIADEAGGEVISLVAGDPVRRLVAAVDEIRTREVAVTQTVERIERFPIFLALAAVALAVGFALSPWRRRALAAAAVVLALTASEVAAQSPPAPAAAPAVAPPAAAAPAPPPAPEVPWWQRWLPGGVRRLARSGKAAWDAGDKPAAAEAFAGTATLDPSSADRLYDLGTALAAGGQLEPALQLLARAGAAGAADAAFNAGTAALAGGQAGPAVEWLRQAVLADPDDADAKRNFELALQLLEQQRQQQQQQQDQQQDQQQQEQQDQQQGQPTPTPQPTPAGGQSGPAPTPTPDPAKSIFAALERAEAEAREAMQSPTPQAATVEKDW